ncbi:hypothetical protein ACFFMN_22070 [Planobispora siamensis]|uniref:Uncharacterized protein n=1 Tax=Planobispora siamensis TaxID=936338 RepID=A0A8J3WQ45_9ACTN|nr:hypothetical protein [Planobispora siamensis]GIH96437.1 hypothetical protein Psi01_70670 [Planobispora siamensis]
MRSAISAGALALALGGGVPLAVATPAGIAAQPPGCQDGGGLLGGVTGGLCKVVDDTTDIVDDLTRSTLSPVTKTVDDTASSVLNAPSEALPAKPPKKPKPNSPVSTPREESSGSGDSGDSGGSSGSPQKKGLLPEVLGTCLPLVSSPGCGGSTADAPAEQAPPATARKPRSGTDGTGGTREKKTSKPKRTEKPAPVSPASGPVHRPETRTYTTRVGDPVPPEPPVIDIEAPRLDPLWPGPLMQEFQKRMPGRHPLAPTRQSDPLGTALTTGLLVGAILAVRVLYARRSNEESIPFEPLRAGRHRTA